MLTIFTNSISQMNFKLTRSAVRFALFIVLSSHPLQKPRRHLCLFPFPIPTHLINHPLRSCNSDLLFLWFGISASLPGPASCFFVSFPPIQCQRNWVMTLHFINIPSTISKLVARGPTQQANILGLARNIKK